MSDGKNIMGVQKTRRIQYGKQIPVLCAMGLIRSARTVTGEIDYRLSAVREQWRRMFRISFLILQTGVCRIISHGRTGKPGFISRVNWPRRLIF